MALHSVRLASIKTLERFDFTFQPSLDRHRILALAPFEFLDRAEVVHLLGPPGTGKSHLITALGVAAVKARKSVSPTLLLSLRAHPLSFLRDRLAARSVLPAETLLRAQDGDRAATVGLVLVRQRPGSAKGVIFMTLEDEPAP